METNDFGVSMCCLIEVIHGIIVKNWGGSMSLMLIVGYCLGRGFVPKRLTRLNRRTMWSRVEW